MQAAILSIGDELILGHTVDTNAAWLSQQLAQRGVRTQQHLTVPDRLDQIEQAIRTGCNEADLLIITGGLGPTEDDLTRQGMADALGGKLIEDPKAVAHLEAWYAERGRPMPKANRRQALVPEGAHCLNNPIGTAPGLSARIGHVHLFAMPGVPSEMRRMFHDHIEPTLDHQGATIVTRRLHTFGISESRLTEKLKGLLPKNSPVTLGTTVRDGVVSICLSGHWESPEAGHASLDQLEETVRQKLDTAYFGRDNQTLAQSAGQLLKGRRQTATTAESCTAGLLGKQLTDEPGSSAYYTGGWIVYTNTMKHELLNVPKEALKEHGAVSEQVVLSLANEAVRLSGADHGLSISGIAGPDGGTDDKPVGTVWIGRADQHGNNAAEVFRFNGDREEIRRKSANAALNLLRLHLLESHTP